MKTIAQLEKAAIEARFDHHECFLRLMRGQCTLNSYTRKINREREAIKALLAHPDYVLNQKPSYRATKIAYSI